MKATKILSHLSNLESLLKDFSYEELSVNEGSDLKKKFESFKTSLEDKLYNPSENRNMGDFESNEERVLMKNKVSKPKNSISASKLIATVSHDMRTPLNGIIGFSDLLKEGKLSENQLQKVEAIQNASDTLMGIVNELLEYSKLSQGLEAIEQRDFNFPNVIQNIEYLCNTLITKPNVSFSVAVEPGIPKILKGDPSKLSQVLLNLLGNSIKFVEKGEIKLAITQKRLRNDKLVLAFSVSDTGIGIAKEQLGHIFDSFTQATNDTFLKYGGSGLGLTIVKQIIELLGGQIEVSSKLGKGTTFDFEIPYEKGIESNIDKKYTDTVMVSNAIKQVKGMRIVVFEDNKMNQRLIELRLLKWGCKVYITDNGPQGLEYIAENKVDVILMDLRMPAMDGYEITKRIRANANKNVNQIPVIAVSADFTLSERKNGEAIGLNDFILKPFNSQELLLKLITHGNKAKDSKTTLESKPKDTTAQVKLPNARLDTMLEECMGDYGFLSEMVRIFKQNILEFIGAYCVHMKNADWENLSCAVLKIKPGVTLLHANSLMIILERLQTIVQTPSAKNIKEMRELQLSFIKEHELVLQTIDLEMAKLGK
ncbi:response regulator [Maribacter sp. ANRC-HE7]|uniref:histidine kinase n=1 Tax=Maribacter aquimaris TaxID=2737171 RepID=A0ABR7UV63_9FLAO|nr:ATP-binding protein [Maribacter aquimaris]MBD0776279.1 response regulator [Maribacter aquimaris]